MDVSDWGQATVNAWRILPGDRIEGATSFPETKTRFVFRLDRAQILPFAAERLGKDEPVGRQLYVFSPFVRAKDGVWVAESADVFLSMNPTSPESSWDMGYEGYNLGEFLLQRGLARPRPALTAVVLPVPAPTGATLGALATWRSPRGMDYSISDGRLDVYPHDLSGHAALELATGRLLTATGTLAVLKREPPVRIASKGFAFTPAGEDFRLGPATFRALTGGAPPRPRFPSSPKWAWLLQQPSSWVKPEKGLSVRVVRATTVPASDGRGTFVEFKVLFRNEGNAATMVQPSRIGFGDSQNLPVMASGDGESFTPQGSHLLGVGESLIVTGRVRAGSIREVKPRWHGTWISFRYGDGVRRIDTAVWQGPDAKEPPAYGAPR